MDGQQNLTDIQKFYRNTTVFLTGATGFLGKLILEKILRTLPVKKVYILVRSKKNVSAQERFNEIFQSPVFDTVKRTKSETLKKVFIVEGDCSLPMLGLSEKDQNTLKEEVSIIFHAAAIVRFDEQIKKATFTNIRATKDLISLAKGMKKLKTFVYTGTGFSNCVKGEIKEEVYPAKIPAESLIKVCENLDNENLDNMTKTLIGEWPNTYTFTKQVVEDYIGREARDISICIIRPTIIMSTLKEPLTAFTDNFFNVGGFVTVICLGLCKIIYYQDNNLDLIPADMVVNACIAAGWQTGTTFKSSISNVPIYNLSTGISNPITKGQVMEYAVYYGRQSPSVKMVSYPIFFNTRSKFAFFFWRMLLHTMVAHVVDFGLKLYGKKPMAVKGVKKLHYFMDTYEYFSTKEVMLHVDNTQKLLRKMSFDDRKLFDFDVKTFQWKDYFNQYYKGLRIYTLKDPMSTVEEGRKRYARLKHISIVFVIIFTIFLYVLGKIFLLRIAPFIFGLVLFLVRSIVC